jgi:hypothetical protein
MFHEVNERNTSLISILATPGSRQKGTDLCAFKFINMRFDFAEKYRQLAEECREHAASAITPSHRDHWFQLAEAWLRLAEDTARLKAQLQESQMAGDGGTVEGISFESKSGFRK